MRYNVIVTFWALAGYSLARPQDEFGGEKAIVPTTSGQIGVNPVVTEYAGSDTQYFSYSPSTTKWIGVDTVIVETITVMANNVPSTTTKSLLISVTTATTAADGTAAGDLTFVISPAGKAKLESLFTEAAKACGAAKQKRDGACVLEYLSKPGVGGGILEGLDIDAVLAGGAAAGTFVIGAVEAAPGTAITTIFALIAYAKWTVDKINWGQAVKIPKESLAPARPSSAGATKATNTASPAPSVTGLFFDSYVKHTFDKQVEIGLDDYLKGVLASKFPVLSATLTGLPKLTPTPSCTVYKDMGQGQCNAILYPSTTGAGCPESTTSGQICTALQPATSTIPDPAPAPTRTAIKLTCATTGSPFKREDALSKATDFCNNAISQGWSSTALKGVDSTHNNPFSSGQQSKVYPDAKAKDASYALELKVHVLISGEACNPGAAVTLDFTKLGLENCIWNFMNSVDGCGMFVKPEGEDYWKTGGETYADCASWIVDVVKGLG